MVRVSSVLAPRIGRTYYVLAFADPQQTMPSVQPWVYLGLQTGLRTLDDTPDGPEPAHYFQDTVSYVRFGPANVPGFAGEAQLMRLQEADLGSMLDLAALADEIIAARERAIALGEPCLARARGTWVAVPPRG